VGQKIIIKFQGRMKVLNQGNRDIEITNKKPPEYLEEHDMSATITLKTDEDFVFKSPDGEIVIE
jgi:hypothetical protein